MEKKVTIFYNPECSKCQNALCSLEERGFTAELIEYLKDVPTENEIRNVLKMLGIPARELIRESEPVFREKFDGQDHSEEEWIRIMAEHPVLIQRPIIIRGDKAVIGRSPEQLGTIF